MAKDPYKILGVDKGADDAALKAAYRKLTKKYHPDLNPNNPDAEIRFKEVNAAYDFLKDSDKRAAFDQGAIDADGNPMGFGGFQGRSGPRGGGGFYRDFAQGPQGARYSTSGAGLGAEDIEDILGSIFGRGRSRGNDSPSGFEDIFGGKQVSLDKNYKIDIGFLNAVRGAERKMTMPDGTSLSIKIPAGVRSGQKLRLKGQGDSKNGKKGDALVELNVKNHEFYRREGDNILIDVPITLYEAILGGKISVPTIHGAVEMTVPKGTGSGKKLRLKGKGVKNGDQLVTLMVVMPDEISDDLSAFMEKWRKKNAYDPRKKMETA